MNQLVEVLISACGVLISALFMIMTSYIKKMAESVEELNKNMAAIMERSDSHEKRIVRIEDEIYRKG